MKSGSLANLSSSIQTKVIFTTVLVVTAILAAFATWDYLSERAGKYASLENSASVASTRLAATLSIPLWDLDQSLINETLASEMLDNNILALVLRDSDGRTLFAAKQRSNDWNVVDLDNAGLVSSVSSRSQFRNERNVTYGDETIGKVEVYVSSRFVDADLRNSLITTVLTVLILDIVIFLVLLLLLRSVIIKPIMRLSESAERMSRGELDIELDFNRRDEIGLVAIAIERMQVSLRIAMGRLSRSGGQ